MRLHSAVIDIDFDHLAIDFGDDGMPDVCRTLRPLNLGDRLLDLDGDYERVQRRERAKAERVLQAAAVVEKYAERYPRAECLGFVDVTIDAGVPQGDEKVCRRGAWMSPQMAALLDQIHKDSL